VASCRAVLDLTVVGTVPTTGKVEPATASQRCVCEARGRRSGARVTGAPTGFLFARFARTTVRWRSTTIDGQEWTPFGRPE
jgi:hypothetical protein